MRKNLFRKPVRTVLLLVSILIAFLIYALMLSVTRSITDFNAKPNRLVTLSKINFTETLPIAHYDKVLRTEGVVAATHLNWFGGYYQDPTRGFLPVFAVEPKSYFEVYKEDLPLEEGVKSAFFTDRTGMLAAAPVAEKFGWKVGQKIPMNSNIFSKADGSRVWDFNLVGLIPTPPGSSQTGSVLIHYEYFNETITFGRDRIGWIALLTGSAAANDQVVSAIDQRFANSSDETATSDEATFNKAFSAQLGNIGLVVSLVVGAAFIAILLIVGTTMTLAVRERTKEMGVMKTLGFSSGRILRMVLGESLLLAFLGAALGVAAAAGLLGAIGASGRGPPLYFSPPVIWQSALIAAALGLVTGALPAASAYRMRIIDALGRK
jgi:putative ABC transport system permease protein